MARTKQTARKDQSRGSGKKPATLQTLAQRKGPVGSDRKQPPASGKGRGRGGKGKKIARACCASGGVKQPRRLVTTVTSAMR